MASRRLQFINKVYENPCLWDLECDNYRSYDVRERAWQSIVDELNWAEIPDVQVAKQEWKKLRDNHRDSIKRHKANSNYKWKYADSMEFLIPYIRTRKRRRWPRTPTSSPPPKKKPVVLESYFDCSDGEITTVRNESDLQVESIKCEPFEIDEDDQCDESVIINAEANDACNYCCKHKKQNTEGSVRHPLDYFYQYLSDTTKQFPTWLQNNVKRKMFDIIAEAEGTADISNPVPQPDLT